MAPPLTADGFYESAREFAHLALAAHHENKHRQVAVNAATALEHLAKACLANRSPALLVELRNGDFGSLVRLLDLPTTKSTKQLRTASLREALERVKTWVTSSADDEDLKTLVGLRDGTVHAALDDEVEEQLLAAFATHADALLADLNRGRDTFWADQLAVVDALLAEATDKVSRRVAVKLAAAKASFDAKYAHLPLDVVEMLRNVATGIPDDDQQTIVCPVCETSATADGAFEIATGEASWEDDVPSVDAWVEFTATSLVCRMCGLRLDSMREFIAANVTVTWEVPGADPRDYDPFDDFDPDTEYDARHDS